MTPLNAAGVEAALEIVPHFYREDIIAMLNAYFEASRGNGGVPWRAELVSLAETLEFNSVHLIAEDTLQDAWKMLDAACEQMAMDATRLRRIISEIGPVPAPNSTGGAE